MNNLQNAMKVFFVTFILEMVEFECSLTNMDTQIVEHSLYEIYIDEK